ncbi:MAG: hypothetical protein IKU77_02525 [Alistipes sp.]|nr:hypothetical protein [Alistipes sp.]
MKKNYLTISARALSMALHPLILPLYLVAMLFTQTAFSVFSTGVKWYLGGSVVLYGTVIPILAILILYKIGWLKDLHIHTRKERVLPLLIGAIAYMVCALVVAKVPQAAFLRKFMVAAALCELFCMVLTIEWKVSLHLTGMGAAVAMLFVLNSLGMIQLFPWLLGTIVAAGLLGSARLYLGRHCPMQVLVGFAGGAILTWIALFWL